MPLRPKPACPACGRLRGCGCEAARRQLADQQRGTPAQRGYGPAHQAERQRLAPLVAAGGVVCPKCHKPIEPGQAWDLGHTDDRSAWTGAEHASCNRAAAARKRNATGGSGPLDHPLFDQAAPFVRAPYVPPGQVLQYRAELLTEDTRQVAVLAILEDRDPREAVASFLRTERRWMSSTTPMVDYLDA